VFVTGCIAAANGLNAFVGCILFTFAAPHEGPAIGELSAGAGFVLQPCPPVFAC